MRNKIAASMLCSCFLVTFALCGACNPNVDACAALSEAQAASASAAIAQGQADGNSFQRQLAGVFPLCDGAEYADVESSDCYICGAGLVRTAYGRSTPVPVCDYPNDGDCDDGRLGARTNLCDPGTDEADCADVDPNVCQTTNDGDCDDGREGADFFICALGTDEADCGPVPAP